jgi:pimeloyl-ACP methyl ester carboxylesterase
MADAEAIPGEVHAVRALDGVEISYEALGKGEPVVFLHGSFVGRGAFTRQRSVLGRHFRLLLISSRGHDGSSATLPDEFGFWTSEVHDVQAVLDAENLSRVRLVAHSTGGATACALALQHPERIARLALIEPTLFPLLPPMVYRRINDLLSAVIDAFESSEEALGWQRMMELVGGTRWQTLSEEKRARAVEAMSPYSSLLPHHARALLNFPVSADDVRALTVPTLLFYGTESLFFEPAISASLRALRGDIRQVQVENAGHNVHNDQADQVNAELLDFLR